MNEFELIRRYFAPLSPSADGAALGIGDDAAILSPRPGTQLAITSDLSIVGRHFAPDADAADVGWKSLAVNLSDLAAMGARPRWFTLALSLPEIDTAWLAGFAAGLGEAMRAGGIALVGGDTTRGPLSVGITALGELPAGRGLLRSGARPGDLIAVTGTLGDAACALALTQGSHAGALAEDRAALLLRLHRPTPRHAAGQALLELASAAIDVSDGLAADLGHVLAGSGVAATVELARLPRSAALQRVAATQEADRYALAGGDDYELCVCLPASTLTAAQRACADAGCPLTVIGSVRHGTGLSLLGRDGQGYTLGRAGYDHFA